MMHHTDVVAMEVVTRTVVAAARVVGAAIVMHHMDVVTMEVVTRTLVAAARVVGAAPMMHDMNNFMTNMPHLHMSGLVDHLVPDHCLRWQRGRHGDHMAWLSHRHRHRHGMIGGRAGLWHRHIVLLMHILGHHIRLPWHRDPDHAWGVVDWHIHYVVDHLCWRRWNCHMHRHGLGLVMRDCVEMRPDVNLGCASNVALVATIALLFARPLMLPIYRTSITIKSAVMHVDLVFDHLSWRRGHRHRHHVWHRDIPAGSKLEVQLGCLASL